MRHRIRVQLANNLTQLAQDSLQLEIDLTQSESGSCSPILAPTRLVPRSNTNNNSINYFYLSKESTNIYKLL